MMTKQQAMRYVRACAEDEGPETYAEAAALFRALYDRDPDTHDGDRYDVWSLCCTAVRRGF